MLPERQRNIPSMITNAEGCIPLLGRIRDSQNGVPTKELILPRISLGTISPSLKGLIDYTLLKFRTGEVNSQNPPTI